MLFIFVILLSCVFIENNGGIAEFVMVVHIVNMTLEGQFAKLAVVVPFVDTRYREHIVSCVMVVLSAHIKKKEDNVLTVTVA